MWDGIPILVPDPPALLEAASSGAPPSDLLSPFLPPSMLGVTGSLGDWLASVPRTPSSLLASWGIQHAPPGPTLDAGCGLGEMALRMASLGRPTWAIDQDPHILVCARDLLLGRIREAPWSGEPSPHPVPILPLRPGQVQLAIADIRTPPFQDGCFAWVHLGEVPLRAGVLAAASALLVDGGVMTLATSHRDDPGRPVDWLQGQLKSLGLSVIIAEPQVPWVRRLDRRQLRVDLLQCVAVRRER